MRKILLLFLAISVLLTLSACGKTPDNTTPQYQTVTIKESPDKYTWYVKSYVGRNLANFGSTSQDGDRIDAYGKGFLKLIFISDDGAYIDPNDHNALRNYVVTGQSIDPNTELKLTFDKYYTDRVDTQNLYEIELFVTKLTNTEAITATNPNGEETQNATPAASNNQSETPVIPTGKFNAEEVLSSLNVTEYSYSSKYSHYGFLVIENTSNFNIDLSASVKFYNDNQLIGAESSSQEAFEKGSKIILYFMPDEKFTKMEYDFSVKEEKYYDCVVSDLSYESVSAKDKEIVSVTNNGSEAAEFVEVYALFFKEGKIVDFDSTYFVDDDYELKPGKTITEELHCYEDYDSVEFFLTGRR